jgi:hypothetical protein
MKLICEAITSLQDLIELASFDYDSGNWDDSFQSYLKGVLLFQNFKNFEALGICYNNIAVIQF